MPRDERRRPPVCFYTRTRRRALGGQLGVRAGKWGRCRTDLCDTSRLGSEMSKNFSPDPLTREHSLTIFVVVGSVFFDNSTKCDPPASGSVWQVSILPVAPHETNKPTRTMQNVVRAVGSLLTQTKVQK